MGKKKKHVATTRDMCLQWLSIIGAVFTIPTVLPPVPWRYAMANANMGARFSMYRYYSLFTVTNHVGQPVSWMKMRKDICYKMEQFNRPNPLAMIVSAVAQNVVGTGGAICGCMNWAECKNHVSQRCSAYITVACSGIASLFFILIGGICAACTPLLLAQEQSAGKKKKKKIAAKQNTMICVCVSFFLNFMGVTTWVLLTDSQFKAMQQTGYYPFAPAFAGAYMCGFGTFILFCAMYCGITRVYPLFKDPGEKKDDEGSDDDGDYAGGQPQMAGGMQQAQPDFGPPPGALPPAAAGPPGGAPPPGSGQPAW